MGITANRNARIAKLALFLLAFACLAVFQPGCAEDEYIRQIRKAAERGDVEAQYDLGFMYASGEGVSEDSRQAVKWFHKAAKQGHTGASAALFLMYNKGKGVSEDYVEAFAWVNLAAELGKDKAVNSRDWLRRRMTAEQVDKAEKLTAELRKLIEASKSD